MTKVVYADGVHAISNSAYHASAGVSRSMLMEFKRSPYHYWYKYVSGLAPVDDPTPAMNLGNAVHTLVLEEDKFDSEFFVTHQKTKPRKGTAPYDKMIEESRGKIILTHDDYLQACLMAKSVKENEDCSLLLKDCLIERSIYFTHVSTGLQVKARPDAWSGAIVNDLKTTANASPYDFGHSANKYGYFLQAAIMNEALFSINQPMEHFVFIAVEKNPPYCTAVYMAEAESIAHETMQFDRLMERLAQCIKEDKWPGYGIHDLALPKYAMFDDEMEME